MKGYLEGVLQLSGYIVDFYYWDDTINLYVQKFKEKYNVYPNILLASDSTYKKIDLYAQKKPNMIVDNDGIDLTEATEPYNGISQFLAMEYSLDCCFDFVLAEGNFTLVFDEAPDFDGEPVPVIEEKVKIYQFRETA
jgi:hypothetical protein